MHTFHADVITSIRSALVHTLLYYPQCEPRLPNLIPARVQTQYSLAISSCALDDHFVAFHVLGCRRRREPFSAEEIKVRLQT